MLLILLSSGLFLGWSLGANDAANVFGSAVGSRMLSFRKAAFLCSVFVILGAVIQGAGTTETLNTLGNVNALGGAFTVALSAGLTVFMMTRWGLPVSTSQAIVGAIIGWNLYAGLPTDAGVLGKIASTWILCPLLAAGFAIVLFLGMRFWVKKTRIHLLIEDSLIRKGLVVIGSFGAYSLGANNIANVMGVFVSALQPGEISFYGMNISGQQQLFFLGALAIAAGVFTYSKRTMTTVGNSLFHLTPEVALIVVFASALVLFVFSSEGLNQVLAYVGIPGIPMVPVSSSQAIIGAILGVGLLKGGRGIKYGILGEIALGWLATPIIAGLISYVTLHFVKNVFVLEVVSKI